MTRYIDSRIENLSVSLSHQFALIGWHPHLGHSPNFVRHTDSIAAVHFRPEADRHKNVRTVALVRREQDGKVLKRERGQPTQSSAAFQQCFTKPSLVLFQ